MRASTEREQNLPEELSAGNLRRRAITIVVIIVILTLVVLLAPGLGEVRDELEGIDPWWLAVAAVFEALSCARTC